MLLNLTWEGEERVVFLYGRVTDCLFRALLDSMELLLSKRGHSAPLA